MSKEHFRFSTAILSRLGEELNPNLDQGILELVKNSYDADAINCVVELINTSQPGGTIKITDDGNGMTKEVIQNGWLVLGRSPKNPSNITKLGRLQVGNKGLGRLASLRMGEVAKIETWPAADPKFRYSLTLDWSKFESAEVVEEVPIDLSESSNKEKTKSGTIIIIEQVQSSLAKRDVHELARSLVLLADPFDNPISFRPVLKAPEFEDLEKLVEKRYFDDAEFHLVASVNDKGKAEAIVQDYKGKKLFSAKHTDISLDNSNYDSPSAQFELWIYILDQQTFSVRNSTLGEVKQWLGQFGGVHLYHRGLRVHPYGNQGHDWLDMNLRRAQSPELRPSTNTCIGKISVSDLKQLLVQKTDRSGFIENKQFKELRRFAIDSLEWMARRRIREREKTRTKERRETPVVTERAKIKIDTALESLSKKDRTKIEKVFQHYERAKDRETKTLKEEVQLYRTLSTVGTTTATFAHETKNSLDKIVESANTVRRRGQKLLKNYSSTIKEPIERIFTSTSALRSFSISTLSLLEHQKRRRSRVQIHEILDKVIELFKPFFDDRQIVAKKQYVSASPYLMGSEAALEAIVINLITNSVRVLEEISLSKQRKILFKTSIEKENLFIRILDSGPGIKGLSKYDIWLPGQTTYPNGTGLGLTIVRDATVDLGGKVDVIEKSELGGAEFIIQLPILGA